MQSSIAKLAVTGIFAVMTASHPLGATDETAPVANITARDVGTVCTYYDRDCNTQFQSCYTAQPGVCIGASFSNAQSASINLVDGSCVVQYFIDDGCGTVRYQMQQQDNGRCENFIQGQNVKSWKVTCP